MERILRRVLALLARRAPLKPGVNESLTVVHRAGLRAALASSSPLTLIQGVLERFGLRGEFEQVVSAEGERFGKPHPGVYLTTAARLGVAPAACVALEDSVNGVLSATAAGMRCIAVPERWPVTDAALRQRGCRHPLAARAECGPARPGGSTRLKSGSHGSSQ